MGVIHGNRSLPKIVVLSVPKSGTNLLTQIIRGIPQMRYRNEPVDSVADLRLLSAGEIGWSHAAYSRSYHRALRRHKIKTVFISRDPRDVAVSFTYFILNKHHEHRLYPYLRQLPSFNHQLLAVIKGVNFTSIGQQKRFGIRSHPNIIAQITNRYRWRLCPYVCNITYEDLMRNKRTRSQALHRITNYLWPDIQNLGIQSMDDMVLRMADHIDPNTSYTFRSGRIGEWRQKFNRKHRQAFKQIDKQNLLIKLGYEQDHRW
ncbi:sulfotransferase domain-containing protein [Mechercharimyces sp. CAU 1602]|uniref:sulfotransferase domain-containing protein n=1 Tax=Mechercharimyces sp. CAU 1602 TaxID=2973933 RepID=UPI002161DCDD|nr:sulfotransferase domain-containing protein [Mechercharimyces sp. CAU 1602]MCS1350143.1 sulfotransferase domain-containing protein [Mechercharimyces sp. CAU 1602]